MSIPYRCLETIYVQLFALVHPAYNLLAAGPAGTGESDYFPAGAGVARTRSRVEAGYPELSRMFRCERPLLKAGCP
jgi:hypothetical protein